MILEPKYRIDTTFQGNFYGNWSIPKSFTTEFELYVQIDKYTHGKFNWPHKQAVRRHSGALVLLAGINRPVEDHQIRPLHHQTTRLNQNDSVQFWKKFSAYNPMSSYYTVKDTTLGHEPMICCSWSDQANKTENHRCSRRRFNLSTQPVSKHCEWTANMHK